MRGTALRDTDVGGKRISAGDTVVMWYIFGNRDETAVQDPDRFIVDREKPHQYSSFGCDIHRCVGARLAALQLAILWKKILARNLGLEVMGEPGRIHSNLIAGISSLPMQIAA